ncbi:MAG: helix-turn-helix transcriptional regulator [Ruminococcaceae bacterium]|nr:helix-turn-helix transcriptional regulator [Oscillospiraceae bacterium]MBO5006331.1 helix-turn-helix transcriptional regulator [Clostridia bacterium]
MKKSKQIVSLSEETKNQLKDALAENLPSLRKVLSLSQNDFGERTGVSRIRLSMIECGKYRMTWSQFTSFILVLVFNPQCKSILLRKNILTPELIAYFECKYIGEEPELDIRLY